MPRTPVPSGGVLGWGAETRVHLDPHPQRGISEGGVTDLGLGMPWILNDSPANEFAYQLTDVVLIWIGVC